MPQDSNPFQNGIADFLKNLADQTPALIQFLTAFVYLAGVYFLYRAVSELKQYGEIRSMMSVQHSLKAPFIYFFVGCLFIFYPSTIDFSLTTIYSGTHILDYANDNNLPAGGNLAVKSIGVILRLIGYISFFRGWIILTRLAGQSAPPGTFWKGINHIIGGIMLVNVFQTWSILKATFGIT